MRRVALATLAHDWLRNATLVLGLAAAWALVTVQLGLRRGFEASSRAVVEHVGGDVWVGARGARVIDDGEPVARSALGAPAACVTRRRPVVVDYAQVRRADGSLVTVQLVGVDDASRGRAPWGIVSGDRAELAEAGAIAIDEADARKLGLTGAHPGGDVELRGGARLRVVAITRGARSFTQTPYVFTDVRTARAVLSFPEDAATFWVHDLDAPPCAAAVKAAAQGRLSALSADELAESTAAHWVEGSGLGALLGAGTLTAALVGAAALLQSAITLVRTYTRELATLRTLGAARGELAAFLAWQVGIVSLLATVVALAGAAGLARLLRDSGLVVVVDGWSWTVGIAVAAASTTLAAVAGGRVLAAIDPREVLE